MCELGPKFKFMYNNNKKEVLGKIIKMDKLRGYGYVRSTENGKEYSFKLYAQNGDLNVNDDVIFLMNFDRNNIFASAVRKYYTNSYGIKFFPRVNDTHMHVDLEKHFPLIVNHIVDTSEAFLTEVYQSDTPVGQAECVKTCDDDKIIYAIRKGRKGYTRFVINRVPEETNYITIVLKKGELGYVIITIYYGEKSGLEPYDERATEKDIEFWQNHALIYKREDIELGSQTLECPYVVNENNNNKLNNNEL